MTQEKPLFPRLTYSLEEFGALTDLSISTVRRMVSREELKTVRLGKRLRVPVGELKRITGDA